MCCAEVQECPCNFKRLTNWLAVWVVCLSVCLFVSPLYLNRINVEDLLKKILLPEYLCCISIWIVMHVLHCAWAEFLQTLAVVVFIYFLKKRLQQYCTCVQHALTSHTAMTSSDLKARTKVSNNKFFRGIFEVLLSEIHTLTLYIHT